MINLDINRFYREVLSELHFSIKGYSSLENKLDTFFESAINTSFFYERQHIEFISYAFAEINNLSPFTIKPLNDKRFFYNTFKEYSLEVYALHEYLCFKKYLEELIPTTTNNTQGAVIASELFHNPTSFSINACDDNFISVYYSQHDDLLKIQIPYIDFFKLEDSRISIRRKVYAKFEEDLVNGHKINLCVNKKTMFTKQ